MKSLSTKLTSMVVAISLVGMGLLAGISIALTRRSVIGESLEGIAYNTAGEAERINGWLENQTSYVSSLAIEYAYLDDYSSQAMLPRLNSHVDGSDEYFDVYMGYPDGRVTFASGFEPDYASGWASTKRPWYTGAMEDPGAVHITSLYTDVQTGDLCLTVAKAVVKDGGVAGVVGLDVLINDLTDIVHQTDVGQDSYAFLLNGEGDILIYPGDAYGPGADDTFRKIYEVDGGVYAAVWQQDGAVKARDADGVQHYFTAMEIPATGWLLYTAIPASVLEAPICGLVLAECAVFVLVVIAASLLIRLSVRRMIVRPIGDLTRAAGELTRGSADIRIDHEYNDEIGELIRQFTTMADSIREQVNTTERLAGGDLSGRIEVRSDQDVMGQALRRLNASLGEFIGKIALAAERVSSGSTQISNSTQVMAEGASRQASAVENIFASVSGMLEQIRRTEKTAGEATQAAGTIVVNVEKGNQSMERMIHAVDGINEASSKISNVIKVIEDIAFQTNILALNAAVEAARAGQHGKGFAVVADEVRNLAAKSAEAANETGALIQATVDRASDGSRIARETSEALQEILSGISGALALVDQISQATREQAGSVDSIHDGIEQINAVVGENAATAEECAAAVQALSQEAAVMMDIVRRFSGAQPAPQPPADRPAPQDYPPMLDAGDASSKY